MTSSQNHQSAYVILSIVLLVVGIAIAVATALDQSFMRFCFHRVSYYIVALLFITWIFVIVQYAKFYPPNLKLFLRDNGWGILFCILLTAAIFVSVGPRFRILSDETNLLSISKTMLFDQDIRNVNLGKWYNFNYQYIELVDPKRPFLFPFLTHLLHLAVGYRDYHPFVVNFLALATIFSLVFMMLRRHLGSMVAYAGIFLIAAQPVVTQTATSGGIDLIMTAFLILCFFVLKTFLRKPNSQTFLLLWVHLLMLSHTRYEAPLYGIVILTLLIWFGNIKLDYFRSSLVYALTPILLLPILWQRFFMTFAWQAPPGVPAFSLNHFLRHNLDFARTLVDFDFFLPYATAINIVAVLSLIFFSTLFILKKWPERQQDKQFVMTTAVVCVVYWVVICAYYHDSVYTPDGVRLFNLAAIVFSILVVMFLVRLPVLAGKPIYLLLIGIIMFTLYHPVSMGNHLSNALVRPRAYRFVMNFLKKQNPADFLLITDRSGLYTVHNYGAVTFSYANSHKEEIMRELREHRYSDIFVIQEIDYETQKLIRGATLDKSYNLELMIELQNKPQPVSYLRISRVVKGGVL